MAAPSRRVSLVAEKRGWCLKKAKTTAPWAKAHHSPRYFVCKGHALCYYERQAPTPQEGGLKGVVDLREVKRVRPSADPTAPEHALDLVLQGRTYVLVPQPPSADEVGAWVRAWAPMLQKDAIAPELWNASPSERPLPPRLCDESPSTSCMAAPTTASSSSSSSAFHGDGGGSNDRCMSGASPKALMKGYLLKMPMRSEKRRSFSASALLGDFAAWKRRYFVLQEGVLQYFADDPGAGGESLGMLQLMADTVIERVEMNGGSSGKLKVRTAAETLVLKDESSGNNLSAWEQALHTQIKAMNVAHESAHEEGRSGSPITEEPMEVS